MHEKNELFFDNSGLLELESSGTAADSPAATWDRDSTKRSLDELFSSAQHYHSSKAYHELLTFISCFRYYSPFNAMLVHIQMPGARFVAPPHRWLSEFRRRIRPGARPIVILQPKGPVMFVFDVGDTDPELDAPPLPCAVTDPFGIYKGRVGAELQRTIENAKRDGIRISDQQAGAQHAGSIQRAETGQSLTFQVRTHPQPEYVNVPLRYELLVNGNFVPEVKYATIVHELAHLYCGHLGTPNEKLWPDRRGLSLETREFEAESVTWLLCERLGIKNPSAEYLAGYVAKIGEVPPISLECVMKSAGLIESMGREKLKARRAKE